MVHPQDSVGYKNQSVAHKNYQNYYWGSEKMTGNRVCTCMFFVLFGY